MLHERMLRYIPTLKHHVLLRLGPLALIRTLKLFQFDETIANCIPVVPPCWSVSLIHLPGVSVVSRFVQGHTAGNGTNYQLVEGVEKICDRLLTPPVSRVNSDWSLFLHAVSTSGNPSDPWITTVTSSPAALAGYGKPRDMPYIGVLCKSN